MDSTGKPGKYKLEWSVPGASACLNARHPRVHIYTLFGLRTNERIPPAHVRVSRRNGILLVLRGLGS